MTTPATSTKDTIRAQALALFARHGYSAVSIRDIARAVGIKESSIYFHYPSKQAIFDSLLADVHAHMDAMRTSFLTRFDEAPAVTEAAFVAVARHVLHAFFQAEPVASFIGMLSIERLHSQPAAQAYRQLLFDLPLDHQTRVFAAMQQRGIFRPADPAALARTYHYAILGAYLGGDSDESLAATIAHLYQREVLP